MEKSAQLSRRVGEATVEVSAYFMGRVLGLTQYLNEHHLVKQGLRFWFASDEVKNLEEASELGGRYQVRLPSYQLDRATFDEEVLRRACVAGADLLRPASVIDVQLSAGQEQTIILKNGAGSKTVRARWVVDASGVGALLARKEGWWKSNTAHPTAAAWSRWKGVKDWDGRELAEKFPKMGLGGLQRSRHGHQPRHRRRLVELVDPAQRRRHECWRRLRSTAGRSGRRMAAGSASA